MYLFSLVTYSQGRSIYIEHLGPEDNSMIPVWIPQDTNNIDFENIRSKMPSFIGVFGFNYSTPQDFDLLECVLKNELKKNTENKGSIWGNLRIVFFDESFNITDERYICCDMETAKTFKELLKLKSVSSNQFISSLFSNYVEFIEADYINR
jgi:hypothetical protein